MAEETAVRGSYAGFTACEIGWLVVNTRTGEVVAPVGGWIVVAEQRLHGTTRFRMVPCVPSDDSAELIPYYPGDGHKILHQLQLEAFINDEQQRPARGPCAVE